MDSIKVFLLLAFVAAINCNAIARDYSLQEAKDAEQAFYETFGENDRDTESYRSLREVHFGDENLDDLLNSESYYTNEGNIEVVNDDVYRPKRQNRNSLSVSADHQHRQGTNFNVEAQRNLWRSNNGRSSLDAQANYNRQFGHGGGRPNYGAGVTFRHRF